MAEDINLNDLQTVVNIIDVCVKRGAFGGDEILAVGKVREKFAAFIKAATPKEEVKDTETKEVAD